MDMRSYEVPDYVRMFEEQSAMCPVPSFPLGRRDYEGMSSGTRNSFTVRATPSRTRFLPSQGVLMSEDEMMIVGGPSRLRFRLRKAGCVCERAIFSTTIVRRRGSTYIRYVLRPVPNK